jgi:Protein of unknown function (DUF732)
MGPYPSIDLNEQFAHRRRRSQRCCRSRSTWHRLLRWLRRHKTSAMKVGSPLTALIAAAAIGAAAQGLAPLAHAAPAPEVEYVYDVMVRRHYNFSNSGDAINYGYGICEKVSRGEGYAQVMGDVKNDVVPNDELSANYLVSYAVNVLCPAQIWQLRNSAAHYQPSADENADNASIPSPRR